jgi:hypothetical protein
VRRNLGRPCVAALLTVAAVAVGGCGSRDDPQGDGTGTSATATATSSPSASTTTPAAAPTSSTEGSGGAAKPVARLSPQEAVAVARRRYPGGRVGKVERDDEDGRAVWKVKLRTAGGKERKVSIAVVGGAIVQSETDRDDGDDSDGGDD